MAKPSKFDQTETNKPKPTELHGPKRGALPTPKAEIERAKPYVIESDGKGEDKPPS